MSRIIEPGTKHGSLTYIRDTEERSKQGITLIECKCDCGNTALVRKDAFLLGRIKTCGCGNRGKHKLEFPKEDITGNTYGHLTVLGFSYRHPTNGKPYWKCQCVCGKKIDVEGYNLKCGNTKSCGCVNIQNLVGKTFGRLTVVRKSDRVDTKWHQTYWVCECSCGNVVEHTTAALNSGQTTSCGCYLRDRVSPARTHGEYKTELYSKWFHMNSRCYSPKAGNYPNYGGRGIRVCDEWKDNYVAFRDWSYKHGWKSGLTLDRWDPNDGYNPDNCRWIPLSDQSKTSRVTVKEYKGRTIEEMCRDYNVPYELAKQRIRNGWKILLATCTPPGSEEDY